MSSIAAVKQVQKLFIANLPWTIGNRELKLYFSKFGHVSSATVVYDKNSGVSRGYGFVAFSTRDGYSKATNKNVHSVEGRALNVQPASS